MRAVRVLLPADPESGGALEALFGARAADDVLTLAEAQAGFLDTKRLPQLLQTLVELLDLGLYAQVEPLGQALPQFLAHLGEALDLDVDLFWCHVV